MEIKEIEYNLDLRFGAFSEGKFLMSGGHITNLLRCLVGVPEVMSVINKANADFEFEKYAITAESLKGLPDVFKLPTDSGGIIALVTGLLYKLDRAEISFQAFLNKYFAALDYNDAFSAFFIAVMEPYKVAIKTLLKDQKPAAAIDGAAEAIRAVALDDVVRKKLLPLVSGLRGALLAENSKKIDSIESKSILDGLILAIETTNDTVVKAIWLGAKSVFSPIKNLLPYVKAIDGVVENYF